MARLTSAQRNSLPASMFAGPGRSYPIEDAAHARNALARAAQHAGPAQRAAIAGKVHKRYPAIGASKPTGKRGQRSARDQALAMFARAAGAGATGGTQRITEDDPRWNPRTMGNKRGVMHSRNASDGHGQYRPT